MSLTINDIRDGGFLSGAAYSNQHTAQFNLSDPNWTYVNPASIDSNAPVDPNGYFSKLNAQLLLAFNPTTSTLAIAFRGTDEFSDLFLDAYGGLKNFGTIYEQAFDSFVSSVLIHASDFIISGQHYSASRILITGHSFGGAMVEEAMARHRTDNKLVGVTFGSPGVDDDSSVPNNPRSDDRLINIGHIDLVTQIGKITPLTNQGDPVFRQTIGENVQGYDIRVDLPAEQDWSLPMLAANFDIYLAQHGLSLYQNTANLIANELNKNALDHHPFDVRAFTYVVGTLGIAELTGSSESNVIIGDLAPNTIDGGRGNDILDGGGGNDRLIAGADSDIIYGGSGTDTVVFSQPRNHYNVSIHDNQVIVTPIPVALQYEGTDTIKEVENFEFSDGTYSLAQLLPPADTTAPQLTAKSPVDNATSVATGANFQLTFNEAVVKGNGNIGIHKSDGTLYQRISVADANHVTFSGTTVSISPTFNLVAGTSYYFNIDSGAILDQSGNAFAGIANQTDYNFTTAVAAPAGDTTPPILTGKSPADNSINVLPGSNIGLTFSEIVIPGAGSIDIHNSDGSLFRSISVLDSSQITFSSNVVTVNPGADLALSSGYYVTVAPGAIRDVSGNSFSGISSSTDLNFTTTSASTPPPPAHDTSIFASIVDNSISEGATGTQKTLSFGVSLSGPGAGTQTVSIGYATQDISGSSTAATANQDYVATSGVLVIPAGQTSGQIDVKLVGDNQLEPDEVFRVALSQPTPGVTLLRDFGTGFISNDDQAPNHLPVTGYDLAITAPGTPVLMDVLANDSDADGNILHVDQIFNTSSGATFALQGDKVLVTPNAGFVGVLSYMYVVRDTPTSAINSSYLSQVIVAGDGTPGVTNPGTIADDIITGTGGNDVLSGGFGDDVIAGGPGADRLDGGAGFDYLDLRQATHGANIQFQDPWTWDDGNGGQDILTNIEGVLGSPYRDLIDAAFGSLVQISTGFRFYGNDGDDRLRSGAGDDILDGGTGNDELIFGAGHDTVFGGSGNDLIYSFDGLSDTAGDILDGGAGDDNISSSGQSPDVVTGGDGNDYLQFGNGDVVSGGSGADSFFLSGFNSTAPYRATITDLTPGDFIKWQFQDTVVINNVGRHFVGPITEGAGTSTALDHIEFASSNGQTTLFFGFDANPGADFVLSINGTFQLDQFQVDDSNYTLVMNVLPTAPAGSVSISDLLVTEGDSGTKVATFTVTRASGGAAFSVNYATANGTATAGSDYAATSGTLNFAAGETSKTISVTIYGDTTLESNETFYVNLSSATNGATVSDSQGIGTIVNDEEPPDLVASLNMGNVTVAAGGNLAIDEYTKNLGNGAAGASTTSYYLSTDSTITTSDLLLTSKAVGALSAYGSGTSWYDHQTFTVSLSGVAAGTYYLGAIADTGGAVSESAEGNNVSNTVQVTVAPAVQLADLQPVSSGLSATTLLPGGSTNVSYTIANLGPGAAAASVAGIYLSTDSTITIADTLLTTQAIAALAANATSAKTATVSLSGSLAPGTYYIGVIADYNGQIVESAENNNATSGTQIIVSAQADLVGSLNMSATSVVTGGNLTIDQYTKNFGAGAAAASTTGFYLSTDSTVTTADTLLTTKAAAALSAYGSGTGWYDHQSFTVSLSGIAAGTYYLGSIADVGGAVSESNETNNVGNVVQITVTPPKPDLIGSLSMSSMSVVAGGSLTIDHYTKNLGMGAAGTSSTAFYLSTDQNFNASDLLLSTKAIGALSAYGSGTSWYDHQVFSVSLSSALASGTYYLGAITDANAEVGEADEVNNVSNAVQITVTPALPDLVGSLNMSNTSVVAGGNLTIDQYTKNFGAGPAGASTTGFYLSTDATVTTADTLLATKAAAALTAYGSGITWYDHQAFTVALSGIAAGTYYLGAIADSAGAVAETSESNNVGNTVQITVTSPALPDLTSSLNMTNKSLTVGGTLAIDQYTKNFGSGAAASSSTTFYLSTDTTFDSSDILLATKTAAALTAYGSGTTWYDHQAFSVALSGVAAGTYYLGAVADAGGAVGESNETNNVSNAVQITVTAPVVPADLTASLNMSNTTVSPGGNLAIDEYTKNFGSGAAASSSTKFYLSTDTTIDTSDILLATKTAAALTAYGSGTSWYDHQAFTVALSGVAAGTYYLGAVADAAGQVTESNESNNVSNLVQVTVASPADLTGSLNMANRTIAAGGSLTIDEYTKNFGSGAAGASTTTFYLSTDTTIDTSDILIATKSAAALTAYGSGTSWYDHQNFSASLSTGLAPGTYYLGAKVDANGQVSESNEANNISNLVQLTVTTPADLIGNLNMGATTVARGGTLNIDEYTKNFGNGATDQSTTAFYLSTDTTIDTSDLLLATRTTSALSGYGSGGGTAWYDHQAFSVTVSNALAPGSYYLGALADAGGQIGELSELNNVYNVVHITIV